MRIAFATLSFVLLGSILLAACGGSKGEEGSLTMLNGKALVEERCSVCHNLGRIKAAQKTQEEWKATVKRMLANGAKLNQAEQEAVIEYLAEAYPK
jgi:mono/diheme cytochrome c family protein